MTWSIQHFENGSAALADPTGQVIVTTKNSEELPRLLRLRDRLVAKEAPDVRVVAIFRPTDPDGLTDVDVLGTDGEDAYIRAIEAAAHRLLVFVADYREAKAMEMQPALMM